MYRNKNIVQKVCSRIAPLWPLKNYVAVNPYLGFTESSFHETAKILASRSDIRMTMPLSFYLSKINDGIIKKEHLEEALVENGQFKSSEDFLEEVNQVLENPDKPIRFKTIVDLVDSTGEINQIMIDSISSFAAAYFDENQAIWKGPRLGLLTTYLDEAQIDKTPKYAGLSEFKTITSNLKGSPEKIIDFITHSLGITPQESEAYYHTLLLKTLGWASYISGIDWNNKLYNSPTNVLEEFLAILLIWEYAAQESFKNESFIQNWEKHKSLFNSSDFHLQNNVLDKEIILQDAFDRSHQNELIEKFNSNSNKESTDNQRYIQSIFCIDVRSEVIRRNIESVNPNIETIGFAGFFGFPIKYKETNLDVDNNQCPVLIPAGPQVTLTFDTTKEKKRIEKSKIYHNQFKQTWKNYKSGAVSAFSFVSPLGIFYLPKLIKKSFKQKENRKEKINTPILDLSHIELSELVKMSENALTAMGIKNNLAEIVLIIGHGSSSTNNPHASGLDCGACGGHSGKNNALTAAQALNDPQVRSELNQRGISIPSETLFVSGLHNTTSDEIEIYTPQNISSRHEELINEAKESFVKATQNTRIERTANFLELRKETSNELEKRAYDWSQVRPEWGLAGCSSFIIGNRATSKAIDFQGRAFLHNYDWQSDPENKILEAILTAPMVVTSWINLQYYASVVDNEKLGAGNKTIHNVTGGIGVIEGSGGDLKTGLSLQSIHNGESFQHLPNRLNVFIEAPLQQIDLILNNHPSIKNLFNNKWIYLFKLDERGNVSHRYISNNNWDELKLTKYEKHEKTTVEFLK